MSLSNSKTAMGAVGELLRAQLMARTSVASVDVGRPEVANASAGPKFNLFLYQVDVDGSLRNHPLDAGQRPPLWLVLRYLLTAFDASSDSDSTASHQLLGEGMLALQELNFLRPAAAALAQNPEPLKITFDPAEAELLSKLMQSNEDHFRVSVAFQVRPVMVAPTEPARYAPLVQTVGPPGDEGVTVLPSLGPRLTDIDPEMFEAGAALTLGGTDLTSEVQWICFGSVRFPVIGTPAGRLLVRIPADTTLSPGSYAITAERELPSGRRLSSNAVLGQLLPTLTGAAPGALTDHGGGNLSGNLVLSGSHLGGPQDGIFVAFYRDGRVRLMVEAVGVAAQNTLTATVDSDHALARGSYRVILRVNGAQAPFTPEVNWI
jgi:hypothetical protein